MALADERVQYEARLADILSALGIGGTSGGISSVRLSIVNYVKAKLDELLPEGEGITFNLSSTPNITNPVDLIINSQLDESARDICLSAPLTAIIPSSHTGSGTPFAAGDKTGYIELPGSFLRLSSFRMADWKKDVIIPITPENPLYTKQAYSFLRGGLSTPVAVLNWKSIAAVNKRILEYYSVDTSHVIEKLFYIPEQTAEIFIAANPNMMPSLAWQCASKVMQIFEKTDLSKMAQERVAQSYTI